MATSITKKPTAKVTGLAAPSREPNTWGWKVKWGVPAAAKNAKSNARATNVEVEWELGCGLNYKDKNGKWVIRNPRRANVVGISYNDWLKCWINAGYDWSNGFKHVTRQSFYPLTKHKIYNIHARVRLTNNKGKGPEVYVYRALSTPRNPSLAAPEHDEETGRVSCTVKVNKSTGEDGRECYDTSWRIKVVDTRVDSKERVVNSGTNTGTEFTLAYDVQDRMQLAYDQYVKVTFEAWTRGFAGDSAHVTKVKYVSFPAQATITKVDVPSTADDAKVTVLCKTNTVAAHPVTQVKLQMLRSVEYERASDIPASTEWDDTGAVDNGYCTALSQLVADLKPTRGTHTWVRLKTIHDHESMFYRYSPPVELSRLFVAAPTAGDDAVAMLGAVPGEDGESIALTLGWNADGTDDADGTEVSWSTHEDAWRSTEEPETYEFEWSDGPKTVGSTTYRDSATIVVRGLSNGTRYFLRARRYMDGDVRTWGDYGDTLSAITGADPGDVTLSAPSVVARGRSLALTWLLGDGPEQESWSVLTGDAVLAEDGRTLEWDGETVVIAAGTGPTCSCTLDADRVASLVGDGGTLPLSVSASRGGESADSAISLVRVADAPTLSVTVPTTVTAQGPTLSLECSLAADVRLTCSSLGASGDSPDGMREQVAGDVVWSAALSPDWEGTGPFTFSVTMPTGLDLWDNCGYVVSAVARDASTGLESEPAEGAFSADWARKAPAPPDSIAVTPSDSTDEDGIRTRQVTITLEAPEDSTDGDTYEVYRMTPDGAYAIAVGQALDATVVDPFAPYGGSDKSYRVALRTSNGDVNWLDYPYELAGSDLRVDFGNQYVELPWNVIVADAWQKDFESRAHLGESTPEGYWNEGVTRTASLSTDVIKVKEASKATTIRALAQHSGPCFVRTPNGSAYEANVSVGGLDYRYATTLSAVTLDATEVALTSEYMAIVTIPEGDGQDDGEEVEP